MKYITIILILFVSYTHHCKAAGFIYWTTEGSSSKGDGGIHRANLDGSESIQIISGIDPKGIVATSQYIYWADPWTDKIQRANLDGSGVTDIVSTGLTAPAGLAVTDSHIYFSEPAALSVPRIGRVDLDGSNLITLVSGLSAPQQIAIFSNKLYWIDSSIQCCNLDGGNLTTIQTLSYTGGHLGLAVDDNCIFRADFNNGIFKSDLSGSSLAFIDGATISQPIGLDYFKRSLYWTSGTGKIMRSNSDGSDQTVLLSGISTSVRYLTVMEYDSITSDVGLEIFTSIELVFPTSENASYQIQTSSNMASWIEYEDPFLGDGTTNSVHISTRGIEKQFYRVNATPLPGIP